MDAHLEVIKKALAALQKRGQTYDSTKSGVEENFTRAAKIASLWLGKDVSPRDVALVLASVKMARIAIAPTHEDSFIDLCNYVAFGAAFSRPDGNSMQESALAADLDASIKAEINGA